MPDITANASVLYESGSAEKVVLYQVKTADTGDTVSVSAKFSKVKGAVTLGVGAAGTVGDVCAVSGTTVTIDAASLSDDTAFLLVIGDAA